VILDLEDIIQSWKVTYGEKRTSQKHGTEYFAIPKHERKELLKLLVQIIKDKGEEKEYFKRIPVKNAIAASCFPPLVLNKDSRLRGYNTVWRELGEILAEIYPDPDFANVKAPTNGTNLGVSSEPEECSYVGPLKELDMSIFESAPDPTTVEDEDAAKFLGFIKDE